METVEKLRKLTVPQLRELKQFLDKYNADRVPTLDDPYQILHAIVCGVLDKVDSTK